MYLTQPDSLLSFWNTANAAGPFWNQYVSQVLVLCSVKELVAYLTL